MIKSMTDEDQEIIDLIAEDRDKFIDTLKEHPAMKDRLNAGHKEAMRMWLLAHQSPQQATEEEQELPEQGLSPAQANKERIDEIKKDPRFGNRTAVGRKALIKEYTQLHQEAI